MPDLVSLSEAKAMLRIDGTSDDVAVGLLISAASEAVLNYLKSGASGFIDDTGAPVGPVPNVVRVATVLIVGELMRNPDNSVEGAFEQGFLPKPVTALLYPLRDPACA